MEEVWINRGSERAKIFTGINDMFYHVVRLTDNFVFNLIEWHIQQLAT